MMQCLRQIIILKCFLYVDVVVKLFSSTIRKYHSKIKHNEYFVSVIFKKKLNYILQNIHVVDKTRIATCNLGCFYFGFYASREAENLFN